jgi:hypothetical protein
VGYAGIKTLACKVGYDLLLHLLYPMSSTSEVAEKLSPTGRLIEDYW